MSKSFIDIVRSSLLVGGAQVVIAASNLVKQKMIAVLLGPSALGVYGLYSSIHATASTITQCGSNQSAVREIAASHSRGDASSVAAVSVDIRRISLGLGIAGLVATCAIAGKLSAWLANGSDHGAICLLGAGVAFTLMVGSATARLQGRSEIKLLILAQVLGAVVGAAAALGILAVFKEGGIAAAIVLTSAIQYLAAETMCSRLGIARIRRSMRETLKTARHLLAFGGAFMYGAVLASVTLVFTRSFIIRNIGEESAGLYQAAYSLSGMVGGFVISAMGADFYPRLVGAAKSDEETTKLVNQQIEVGALLASPALLVAVLFPGELMRLLFADAFVQGAGVLRDFSWGVYLMVLMFPIGMIQRARASSFWMYIGQSEANILHVLLILLWGYDFGLAGIGKAFVGHIALHFVVVYLIGNVLSGYKMATRAFFCASVPVFLYAFYALWCATLGDSYAIRFLVVLFALAISSLRVNHARRRSS